MKANKKMEFKNLKNCDFETVFRGFERAFADYAIRFEKEEVSSMLERRGYNPGLSFALFDCDEIVAFTLNGIGQFNNLTTAYDTGTGTAKEYRGQGLAGEIFTRSIPFLKDAGVEQYLLEVLNDNDKAIAVYHKLGFETVREFDCFRQMSENVKFPVDDSSGKSVCNIQHIDIESIVNSSTFCDFSPSWQNTSGSIERGREGLTMLGAFIDKRLVGYSVFDSATGDLTQIAVKPEFRGRGIATRLLQDTISGLKTDFIKVLNVDSSDETLHKFLERRNIMLSSKQLEMRLEFD